MPREALRSENGKPYVYKVVDDSLVRTPVTTDSQPDPGAHPLRTEGGRLGGDGNNQWTALAGGRSDQGCRGEGCPAIDWAR